jgi:2-methylcitrate dehydratase PrpD
MKMSITENLARFIVDTEYGDIPEKAKTKAKLCMLDCFGALLAGSVEPISKPVKRYVERVGCKEEATVIGLKARTSVPQAAFANGVFGHVLDYDDTNQIFVGHATVVILPTLLALGEAMALNGEDMITAYMVGTEVQWKLGDALVTSGNHYGKGWHSTGTIGSFGAAAAAGKLLGLDEEKMTNALGIAASEAAGFQEQFGTHCKSFHAGRANENGVTAALLASEGFTSSRTALEGKLGYLRVSADRYDANKINNFGDPWGILEPTVARGINLKKYPVCGGGVGSVEGILSLVNEYDLKPDEVELIECHLRPKYSELLMYHDPKTGLEAKFSMEYWMARALLDRELGLQQFTDEKVLDQKSRELVKRVKLIPDQEMERPSSKVRIVVRTRDNRLLEKLYFPPKGTPENPMTEEELKDKYRECAEWGGVGGEGIEESMKMLMEIERLEDVGDLMRLMRARII